MTVERFDARIGANIRDFQRKIKQADQAMREMATGVDVDLDLATEEFFAEVQAVKAELQGLENKDLRIQVDLAYAEFRRQLAEVYAMAETMDDYEIDVAVDAMITDFRRKLSKAKMLAQGLDDEDIDINVDLNTAAFYAQMAKIGARIAYLKTKSILIGVKVKYNDFQRTMGRIASQMRNWGEIFSTQLTGALITLITTLPALISSLVGLIGSLGVMIGVLAGQFMILASALSITALGFVGLTAVAIPTIKALFDETAKLTAEQQRARGAWDGFVAVYDEMVKKTEGAVLTAFTKAMEGATKILRSLEPMILSVADSAAVLMDAFSKSIDSAPIQRIFETFNQYGGSIFENVVAGLGSFTGAIGSMIAAFTPAAEVWSENFRVMMESFAAWADGLAQSESFQSFIEYIQTYMPVISQIFGDLIVGITEFFGAFSGMAGDFMLSLADMMEGFREWASTLGENQQFQRFLDYIREATPQVLDLLKNLWDFIINLGVAMAPFGAIVLDLANKFLAWVNAKMEAEGMISKLIGILPILIGGFMMLMAPLTGLITLFGPTLVGAIKLAIKAFNLVKGAIVRILPSILTIGDDILRLIGVVTNLASKALPWLMRGFTLLTGPVGIAIAIITTLITIGIALYKNWDTISAYAKSIWTTIANFFSTTVAGIYDTVVGWFGDMWNSIVQFMNDIVTSITNGWNDAVSFLSGINLVDIGKDIVRGLVDGISSGFDWVKRKVAELANLVPDWLKGPLGIHSPSRVMAAVAKWVPAGVAKGITDNLNVVKTAAKELAGATMPDFSKTMKVSEQQVRAAQNAVSGAINASKKEIQKITSDGNKEITKIESKLAKDIKSIQKTASNKKRSLTKAELNDISKLRSTANKEIKAIETKMAEDVAKKQRLLNAEKLENLTNYIEKQIELHGISAAEEAAYWKYAATAFKDGTDDKLRALNKYNDAHDRAMKEQFDNEIRLIDEARKYNAMSLAEEIAAYEEYMKSYKVGSEEQVAYERKIYDAKKALYNDLKDIAEDYLSKVQDVYSKLADEEQKLRDEFQKTFESRRDTIANTWGLFDEVKLTEMVTYNDDGSIKEQINLLDNMRQQVNTLSQWMQDLASLTHRGVDEGLIQELQKLGPKAAAEIAALARMSGTELQEYERLWKAKMELAGAQATSELAGAREDMEKEIIKLRENAAKELDKMKIDMLKEVDEMVNGSTDTFDILTATLPEIGKHAMQGLIDAFKEMSGPLKQVIQSIANDVSSSMEDILMGEHFNASSFNPATNVLRGVTSLPKVTGVAAPETPPVNITLNQNWTGEDVSTYIDQKQGIDAKFNIIKR